MGAKECTSAQECVSVSMDSCCRTLHTRDMHAKDHESWRITRDPYDHVMIPLTDHRFESFVFNLARYRSLNTRLRGYESVALVSQCYLHLTMYLHFGETNNDNFHQFFSLALTPAFVVQFVVFNRVNNSASKIRSLGTRVSLTRREKSFPDVIFFLLVYLPYR